MFVQQNNSNERKEKQNLFLRSFVRSVRLQCSCLSICKHAVFSTSASREANVRAHVCLFARLDCYATRFTFRCCTVNNLYFFHSWN